MTRKTTAGSENKAKDTKKSTLKRKKILAAAAKIFGLKGYAEATLAEIGIEAGTHAGSLYYYFASKEDLVEEVLNIGTRGVEELVVAAVDALPKDTPPLERFRTAFQVHVSQMLLKDDFIIAYWKIIDQVPEEIKQRHLQTPRNYGVYLQNLIDDAQKAGQIRQDIDGSILRLMMVGSSIYALEWYHPEGRLGRVEVADVLIEMFFNGVTTTSQTT